MRPVVEAQLQLRGVSSTRSIAYLGDLAFTLQASGKLAEATRFQEMQYEASKTFFGPDSSSALCQK